MTKTAEVTVEVSISLAPITYIDRDGARWTVKEGEHAGQPVLKLRVEEASGTPKEVVFYKADAEILGALIEIANGK